MAKDQSSSSGGGSTKSSTSKALEDDIVRIFEKFDANGDGKISASELRQLMTSLGSETTEDEVRRMMSEMDKDGDGYVDFNEFVEFQAGSAADDAGAVDRELREAFDMYDKDKNGLISARELHAVLKSLGEKCSIKDCSRMIQSVDVDGDGHVNFEEFKKMMA